MTERLGDDSLPEFIQLSTKKKKERVRVPLFAIDDKEYTVPIRPPVSLALKYLRTLKDRGTSVAVALILEELLGADGYEALCNYPDLEPEEFEAVAKAAITITLGAMNSGK